MNIIKYEENNLKCPMCNSINLIKDSRLDEIYCYNCGLVVKDNSFLKPSQVEYMLDLESKTSKKNCLKKNY